MPKDHFASTRAREALSALHWLVHNGYAVLGEDGAVTLNAVAMRDLKRHSGGGWPPEVLCLPNP